jgi:hypothetical protein
LREFSLYIWKNEMLHVSFWRNCFKWLRLLNFQAFMREWKVQTHRFHCLHSCLDYWQSHEAHRCHQNLISLSWIESYETVHSNFSWYFSLPHFFSLWRCHGARPPPNLEFTLKPKKKKNTQQSESVPGTPCPPCPELEWRPCVGQHIGAERMVCFAYFRSCLRTMTCQILLNYFI